MIKLPVGTRVRMSPQLRRQLIAHGSGEHVAEFGGCVGTVVASPATVMVDGEPQEWPECEVAWTPSLRYLYDPTMLLKVGS